MTNLQVALDELKSEVSELDKKKTSLAQDCITLESKKRFLTESITKLRDQQDEAQTKHDAALLRHEDALVIIRHDIKEAEKELETVTNKITVSQSDLELMVKTTDEEIVKLNKILQDKKNDITACENVKKQKAEEVVRLDKDIAKEQSNLSDLIERVKQAEIDTEAEIAKIWQSVAKVNKEIEIVNKKLDAKAEQYEDLEAAVAKKQTELAKATKKHQDYLEYEKRADKALKARETALLEGESKLATARRRSGVLDNL